MQEAGLIQRLNLAVISTQGFSTRAARKLLAAFVDRGIKVYVLHDCDISGYLIHDKIAHGSDTFKAGLEVTDLGLTVADVEGMDKMHHAEIKVSRRKYEAALEILTPHERDFFIEKEGHKATTYRRVELNALTMPEFLQFVERKISEAQSAEPIIVKPTKEQLKNCLHVDREEIVKAALYEVYGDEWEVKTDLGDIAEKIHANINGKEHWTVTVDRELEDWRWKEIEKLAERIKDAQDQLPWRQ